MIKCTKMHYAKAKITINKIKIKIDGEKDLL